MIKYVFLSIHCVILARGVLCAVFILTFSLVCNCRLDTTLGKPLHMLTRDKERVTVFSKLASMENQMQDLDRKMDQILVLLRTQHQEIRGQR